MAGPPPTSGRYPQLDGGELPLDPSRGVEAIGQLPGDGAQQSCLGLRIQVTRALGERFDHAWIDRHASLP